MNIRQENLDELNAILKVTLNPEDYQERVEKALKEYRKKARIPGFRPGMAPITMIKKMIGTAALVEEINKLLNEKIDQYIKEQNLSILGSPLPRKNDKPIDWEKDTIFEFEYEIGFSPDPSIDLSHLALTKYVAEIDEDTLQKQIENITRRYGKVSTHEQAQENDILYGNFEESDEKGNVIENGVHHKSTLLLENITEEELKKLLMNLKVGDSCVINPHQIWKEEEIAHRFHISHERAREIRYMKFTLERVNRLTPAELNQELFDKIYGKDSVKSSEDFKERVRKDLERTVARDSEYMLKRDIKRTLLKQNIFALPDDFLKRWIKATNEKPITDEQLEMEYPYYAERVRWDLIQNKLSEKYNIKATFEELEQYVKNTLADYYLRHGLPVPEDNELKQAAYKILSNREELNKYYRELVEIKLFDKLVEEIPAQTCQISYKEFMEKMYS